MWDYNNIRFSINRSHRVLRGLDPTVFDSAILDGSRACPDDGEALGFRRIPVDSDADISVSRRNGNCMVICKNIWMGISTGLFPDGHDDHGDP